jgi:signal transduction histidine kinase
MPAPWGAVYAREEGESKMIFNYPGGKPAKEGDGPSMLWYERTRVAVMEKGILLAWLFTIADVTDRVALKEREADEIRQASEAARIKQWHGLLRDLHDGIGPVSTTIGLLAERALRAKAPGEKDELLKDISHHAENGHVELRTLMNMMEYKRMSWPDILVEARRFSRLISEARDIALNMTEEGAPPAEPPSITCAMSLLRIIKEAVYNTAKHSGATEVTVSFTFSAATLRLVVRDNGKWRETGTEGRGLRHIHQRVAELRGSLVFQTAPDTCLTCILPTATLADPVERGGADEKAQNEYLHCRG